MKKLKENWNRLRTKKQGRRVAEQVAHSLEGFEHIACTHDIIKKLGHGIRGKQCFSPTLSLLSKLFTVLMRKATVTKEKIDPLWIILCVYIYIYII